MLIKRCRNSLPQRQVIKLFTLVMVTLVMLGCHTTMCWTTDEDCQDADRCCKPRHDAHTMGGLADAVTHLEDSIQRVGTITVKQPDVYGETNLMGYIQEYEQVMLAQLGKYEETAQAYVARSDNAVLSSQTALGMALGKDNTNVPGVSKDEPFNLNANTIQLGDANGSKSLEPFDVLSKALTAVKPNISVQAQAVSIEPTEKLRQQSTYIHTNQYLRRINSGDDNSQSAGYGMYLVRMPVSIQPGNMTREGYSGVVTFRAQMHIDENHLPAHFSRLLVNDLTDQMTGMVLIDWLKSNEDYKSMLGTVEKSKSTQEQQFLHKNKESGSGKVTPPASNRELIELFTLDSIAELRELVKSEIGSTDTLTTDNKEPQPDAVRRSINRIAQRMYGIIKERDLNSGEIYSLHLQRLGNAYARSDISCINQIRCCWCQNVTTKLSHCQMNVPMPVEQVQKLGWMLVMQGAILEQRVREYVRQQSPLGLELDFANAHPSPMAKEAWRTFILQQYPLYVFALDPVIEEQNVYDAFSRRRELQIAVAYALANGKMNFQQANKFTRQLALDLTTIALNRTQVGFAHGNDTFGWRFYPRVQSPPEESSNLHAAARMLWATGPTRDFDLRHRMIEPGMRECEVLLVMPSFVPTLKIDVTTNWERLHRPGSSKLDYDDMIQLGKKLECVRKQSTEVIDQNCYRAGDYERLVSRIDQLERMLPLQTYNLNIPYQHELSGDQIFDKGTATLQPLITGIYGLEVINRGSAATDEAHFFVTGRNFNPTRTHVIVGGAEAHAIPDDLRINQSTGSLTLVKPAVEVISRELLKVKIKVPNGFTCFEKVPVRVATPAGISNELKVQANCASTMAAKTKTYGFSIDPKANALTICYSLTKNTDCTFSLKDEAVTGSLRIRWDDPVGTTFSSLDTVVIKLDDKDSTSDVKLSTVLVNSDGVYELQPQHIQILTSKILQYLKTKTKDLSACNPLPNSYKTIQVTVTPSPKAGYAVQPVVVEGSISITLKQK